MYENILRLKFLIFYSLENHIICSNQCSIAKLFNLYLLVCFFLIGLPCGDDLLSCLILYHYGPHTIVSCVLNLHLDFTTANLLADIALFEVESLLEDISKLLTSLVSLKVG